jgi:hypothetical protein
MARTFRFGLVCWLLASACSDASGDDPAAGGGGNAGSGGAAGSGGSQGTPDCAQGPGYREAPMLWEAGTVTANLVGLDNAPAAGVECALCGIDVCITPVDSDADGNVTIQTGMPLDAPAFKVGNGLDYAKFAFELPEGTLEHVLPNVLAAELTDTLQPFETGAELASGDITVRLPPGGVAVVDTLSFPDASQQTFRAVEIPGNRIASLAPADLDIELLFVTGPVDTKLCPSAEVTVPNRAGWEPGSAVEFWLHGSEVITEQWAPYAGWAKVSGGTVSDDGLSVTSNAGEGLPVLGVVGVRLASP